MQLDKEDMRNYEQRAFFEKNDSNGLTPLSIFFAFLGAILVSWFIRQAYVEWQVQQAVAVFNQQMQIITAQSQAQFKSIQLQNEARRAEAEEKIRIKAETQEQQRVAKIQMEDENRARIAAAIDDRVRKDQAWKLFYKPIKGCEAENPNREAVKCGNDYIKARKRFGAAYQAN